MLKNSMVEILIATPGRLLTLLKLGIFLIYNINEK